MTDSPHFVVLAARDTVVATSRRVSSDLTRELAFPTHVLTEINVVFLEASSKEQFERPWMGKLFFPMTQISDQVPQVVKEKERKGISQNAP